MLVHRVKCRFVLLNDHSNEVTLHCLLESELVLVRVNYCGYLSSVNDPLELALEDLVESVLLHIVNNTEANLLPLSVNDSEE